MKNRKENEFVEIDGDELEEKILCMMAKYSPEIHVGDEITFDDGKPPLVVTFIRRINGIVCSYDCINWKGMTSVVGRNYKFMKTGRHFCISGFLDMLKEVQQ